MSITEQLEPEKLVEEEADLFASDLLMPPSRFEAVIQETRPGLAGILKVAKKFSVSCSSAALRVPNSGVEPLAMAYWRNDKRPWTEVNMAFQVLGFTKVMRRADHLSTRLCHLVSHG